MNPSRIMQLSKSLHEAALDHDEALAKELGIADLAESIYEADKDFEKAIEAEIQSSVENDAKLGRLVRDCFKAYRWSLAVSKAVKDSEAPKWPKEEVNRY